MFQHTIFLCDFQYWDILLIFIHKLQNLSTETTRNLWKSGIDSWTDRGTGQMREFKYGMLDLWSCHTCHDINTNQLSICTCMVAIAKNFHIVWHNSCTVYVITYDDTFLFAQSKLFIWQGMDLNIISITNNRLEMIADDICFNVLTLELHIETIVKYMYTYEMVPMNSMHSYPHITSIQSCMYRQILKYFTF